MKVSADLLTKAASSSDPAVRKLAAETVKLEAEDLKGRAFHQRSRHLEAVDAALRLVMHGGVPLPAALEQSGLKALGPRTALGNNPGDIAAIPTAKR